MSFCVDRLRLTVAEIDLPAIGDQLKRRCHRDGLAATVNAVLPEGKLIVDAVSAACGQHGERQKAQRQRPFFLPMIIHIYHSFGCSSEIKLRSLIFHIIS